MAQIDETFQDLYDTIFDKGREYHNVNRNVKRLQIPSYLFRHEFKDGFPAITTKKLYFKSVIGELIWMLRGDNNVKYLNDNGIRIWNKDAYNWHVKQGGLSTFEEFEKQGQGSVGKNYSYQWRRFNGQTDQIKNLIENMKKDIMSSRLKVNAWNPSELNETPVPPCPSEFQVIGIPLTKSEMINIARENGANISYAMPIEELRKMKIPEFGFELHWNQRSTDAFLGLPFDVASMGALALILQELTGFKALAIEGSLKCVHFYDNAYLAAKTILDRDPNLFGRSWLVINKAINWKGMLNDLSIDRTFNVLSIRDFQLKLYESYPEIKVEMLAPINLTINLK